MWQNSQYTILWSFLKGTRVQCKSDKKFPRKVRIKDRVFGMAGAIATVIGWCFADFLGSVWTIHNILLRNLVAMLCFVVSFETVFFALYLFLCVQNRHGKLPKYIIEVDASE